MTQCIAPLSLPFHPVAPVVVTFDAPHSSTDGGLLLLGQLDSRLGLCARMAALLTDRRDPSRIHHTRHEQLRQRVFQIAMGYEDGNDADSLRDDPMLQLACARRPGPGAALSSQPTLSRLEHAVTARVVCLLQRALEQRYVDSLAPDTSVVVLDLDTSADPVHGQQPLAFFHGHYDATIYFPAMIFDDRGRLVSVRLRPGNAGNHRYTVPMVERVIRRIKARFPDAQIVLRGDAGFSSPRMLDRLEALNDELKQVDYLLGFEKNSVLLRLSASARVIAQARFAETGVATRTFTSFSYKAGSWSRARHIVAKAEHMDKGPNPRFLVTSLEAFPPRMLYEWGYCARGQAENYIKDFKRALKGDRLSCTSYVANAFRLMLHAFAYELMYELRACVAVVAPSLARVQFDTLRLRVLKVCATVRTSVRRIVVALPSAFPAAPIFRGLAAVLGVRATSLG
jgi:hypothetical protein